MAKKRDYKKEYREYHAKPEQKKRRAQRNAARRKAEKQGKVRKGDGKEVDHIGAKPTGNLDNSKVRVVSRATNRRKSHKKAKRK
jgi:hypothetical protein